MFEIFTLWAFWAFFLQSWSNQNFTKDRAPLVSYTYEA